MSSKNRGSITAAFEYYRTPAKCIEEFWNSFCQTEKLDIGKIHSFLDPCAGGDSMYDCPYPAFFKKILSSDAELCSIDIRDDSKAKFKTDYFSCELGNFDLIISNPPYSLFEQFVEKAHRECFVNGYIIFLLRLNTLAGQARNYERNFWNRFPNKYCFVHSRRPCFIKSCSDSCEYAHFVWQKGYSGKPIVIHV